MEGDVGAGDRVEWVVRDQARIGVSEITRVYAGGRDDVAAMERLVALDALPNDWRSWLEKQLAGRAAASAGATA